MSDRRYQAGSPREQALLLPRCVEDYVSANNPVRAIDVYVDSLDLERLGFNNTQGGLSKGRPAYCPSDLLKLYLYGYLNRVRSSRRLEQETYRNLEVIWLLKELHPCYKTISDFRKNNLSGIKAVNKDFVLLCRELDLYGGELVGIDGSFFSGSASRASVHTPEKLEKQLKKLEDNIAHYLEEMKRCDQEEGDAITGEASLEDKLSQLRSKRDKCLSHLARLEASGHPQLCTTDKDARLLSKRGQSTVGYNVQCGVDEKHKLLVACDVVNDGNDARLLLPMSVKCQEVLESESLEVVADRGYYNQSQIKECIDLGITPYVPHPDHSAPVRKSGRYERRDFIFDHERDAYRCPGGAWLERGSKQIKGGKLMIKYAGRSRICRECALKDNCLPKKTSYRQIYRYEHEDVLEAHQELMREKGRAYMKKRAGMAEHPFGVMKIWLGWTHFLLRGFKKVRAEMHLLMLSYNFKRVLNILGVDFFRAYCLKRRLNWSVQFSLLVILGILFRTLLNTLRPIFPLKQDARRLVILPGHA